MNASRAAMLGGLLSLLLAGCGGRAELSIADSTGPRPVLPQPERSVLPLINVVTATPWEEGAKPQPAAGLTVDAFARNLDHPRWLYVLPNGDVLVAETNAPSRAEEGKGVRGWLFSHYLKKAGGAVPSANRIIVLRDADGDGVAEFRSVLLDRLNSPFGMVLVGHSLFVANTDALVWFPYSEGESAITAAATTLTTLPAGPLNHHWTKNVIASPDGSKLYVAIGSNSNVGENGLDKEEGRAAIWEVDARTGQSRVFASGLRNPVGMAWEPDTAALWVVVNERDELGSDLPPDYMTAVGDGAFYGWPYSYYGQNVDPRLDKAQQKPELVARAVVPDYALGPHTAPLGLAWSKGTLPAPFTQGMFIGQHGSWNRKPLSGYKVIFVPFTDGKPSGQPIDVLTGFVTEAGEARGRPVGVAFDKRGALLVADDVGNTVWRIAGSNVRLTER